MNTRQMLRMAAPMAIVTCSFLVTGLGAAWYLGRVHSDASDRLARNVSGLRAAEELVLAVRDVRVQLIHFVLTGDRKHLDAVPALHDTVRQRLDESDHLAGTPREEEMLAQIRQADRDFLEDFGRVRAEASPAKQREGVQRLADGWLTMEVLEPCHAYLDLTEELAAESTRANQRLTRDTLIGLGVLGVCGAAAGLAVGLGLVRTVRRSLGQLHVPIADAAGRLNAVVGPITLSGRASFPELQETLHAIALEVGRVIEGLEQSRTDALRAERLAAVGQMGAGLAHELRNPLMAVKVIVQAARGQGPESGLRGEDLAMVEGELTRLERSLRAFLDFARPPQPERRPLDVRGVVEEECRLLAPRAEGQAVKLVVDVPAEPVVLEADRELLRTLLHNLLVNALDSVAAGGTVWVRLEREGAGWAMLRVADNGCGLPPALGARIFEPFQSTKPTGMGLGLSLARRAAEAHGGALTAASRPEGGAVFTARLPTRPPAVSRPR